MNPQLDSIYCDDIRQEISGQRTFVGVYSGALFVKSLPVTLPKFCVLLKFSFPPDCNFNEVIFRVFNGDEMLGEFQIGKDKLFKIIEGLLPTDNDGHEQVVVIQAQFAFSPMHIGEPTVIRVRVIADGHEIKGAALSIRDAPEKEDQPTNVRIQAR